MDRRALESAGAHFPYLQGLWTIPMGFTIPLAGVTNLRGGPHGAWLLAVVVGLVGLAAASGLLIWWYYRDRYGNVTPTPSRQVRHVVAVGAWVAVLFVGANRHLLWSPTSSICIFAVAFALATLAYYVILVGLRPHHVLIWGTVLVAGLLPVWGGLGVDRDAWAMVALGVPLIGSGLLDQHLLARAVAFARSSDGEIDRVGT